MFRKRVLMNHTPRWIILSCGRNRYSKTGHTKNLTEMLYQPDLLVPIVTHNADGKSQPHERRYSLHGVVTHIGASPTEGHYIATVKSGTDFYVCDNESVKKMKGTPNGKNTSLRDQAYILCYKLNEQS